MCPRAEPGGFPTGLLIYLRNMPGAPFGSLSRLGFGSVNLLTGRGTHWEKKYLLRHLTSLSRGKASEYNIRALSDARGKKKKCSDALLRAEAALMFQASVKTPAGRQQM